MFVCLILSETILHFSWSKLIMLNVLLHLFQSLSQSLTWQTLSPWIIHGRSNSDIITGLVLQLYKVYSRNTDALCLEMEYFIILAVWDHPV